MAPGWTGPAKPGPIPAAPLRTIRRSRIPRIVSPYPVWERPCGPLRRTPPSGSARRADVAAGRYQVDAQTLSQRLIDDMFRNDPS